MFGCQVSNNYCCGNQHTPNSSLECRLLVGEKNAAAGQKLKKKIHKNKQMVFAFLVLFRQEKKQINIFFDKKMRHHHTSERVRSQQLVLVVVQRTIASTWSM